MKLKPYKAKKLPNGTGLTCPRACGGKFIVNLEQIVEERQSREQMITTIPCPYCFKVSLIPASEDVKAG